ncbi:MAG TPA: glycosyltransferase family 39 protein, partial [Methylomirabilota bacterium]|nr:glycosyltransferase family 39 protein [Methylomirabilota bacterium]
MTGAAPASTRAARDRTGGWALALVLAALTVGRLTYLAAGTLDLSPDEAHYWEWSRRLDLSYYSKGPLVAYAIRGLTALLGDSAFAIRSGAAALSLVGAWALYRLGSETFGRAAPGALAVIGLQLTPLVWAGSLLMTIDSPFLVLWSLLLLALHRALTCGSITAWMGAGLALGLGVLAKYTALFAVPGVALYLWRAPEARRVLRQPGPCLAALVALVVVSPVLVWNARQGWISARHVASQGRGGGLTLGHLVDFVGSQVGVLTPLVAGLLAWGAWHALREGLGRGREPYRFLAAFGIPILAFYLVVALQGKVQANWAAAAYPSLAIATAGLLLERRAAATPRGRRAQNWLLGATAGLALLVSLVGHVPDRLGLPPRLDPTLRLRGWRELGARVAELRAGMPEPDRTF